MNNNTPVYCGDEKLKHTNPFKLKIGGVFFLHNVYILVCRKVTLR